MFCIIKRTKSNEKVTVMITQDEPRVNPTSRYDINATCRLLTISRKTLAKYTKAGYIQCKMHKSTNKKFYVGQEIRRFWLATV